MPPVVPFVDCFWYLPPELARLLPHSVWLALLLWQRRCLLTDSQVRLGRDGQDADAGSAETVSTLSDGVHELQDISSRKNRKQLTSTEYALQEIRYAAAARHSGYRSLVCVARTPSVDPHQEMHQKFYAI